MSRALRYTLSALVVVALSIGGLGLSINHWFIPLVQSYLPQGVRVEQQDGFSLSFSHLSLPTMSLFAGQCQLAQITAPRVALSRFPLKIAADKLVVDTDCLSQWPTQPDNKSQPLSLSHLQHLVPAMHLDIASVELPLANVSRPS